MRTMRGLLLSAAVVTAALAGSPCRADPIDDQQKALRLIADFADRICNIVSMSANSQDARVSGDVKAQLNGLFKKLADLV